MRRALLGGGYIELVESWGSDERIVEAARMSTAKGFLGWGPRCVECGYAKECGDHEAGCSRSGEHESDWKPGDEKLLAYLWDHQHATPFEMAGLTFEVKAPIMVFREWHRHRTQGFNEMSARYVPLPNDHYVPTVERVRANAVTGTANRQAQGTTGRAPTEAETAAWLAELEAVYGRAQEVYERGLAIGVPKELARLPVPVARYSVMRATANLRNWIGFLRLRCDAAAQWEIRQYADAIADTLGEVFPRTYAVAKGAFGR